MRMTARRRGQSTVELALTLPVLLLLVLGIVDFGRVFLAANVISHASRDAARHASLNSTDLAGIRRMIIDEGGRSAVTIIDADIDIVYLDGQSGQPMTCYLRGSSTATPPDPNEPNCKTPAAAGRTFPAKTLPGDLVQVSVHLPWSAETAIIQGLLPSNFTVDSTAASTVEQ